VGCPALLSARRVEWRHNGGVTDGWRVLSLDHRDPVAPLEEIVTSLISLGSRQQCPMGGPTSSRPSTSASLPSLRSAPKGRADFDRGRRGTRRRSGRPPLGAGAASGLAQQRRRFGSSAKLDQQVIHAGAYRLLALVSPDQVAELAFANQGFVRTDGLRLYTRDASMVPEELAVVEKYGGHFPWPVCGMR